MTVVQGLLAPDLVSALEANIDAQLPLMYAHMPRVRVLDEPDLLGIMTGLEPMFNGVCRANVPPDRAATRIDQVLDRFRAQKCRPRAWLIGPSTQPSDLGKHLEVWEFTLAFRLPGMAAELGPHAPCGLALNEIPTPARLVIERVRTVRQLKQWFEPVKVGFDLSEPVAFAFFELFASQGFGSNVPWQLFVGTVGGQPVAASRLFCAAGVAGIYQVATLPQARGQGFGTAMTLAAARAGREFGYRVVVLGSSPAGYGLYRRLGFQEVCHTDVYLSPTNVDSETKKRGGAHRAQVW